MTMKHPLPDHNPMRAQYRPAPASPQHFALSLQDGVATLTLNRPDKRNALSLPLMLELTEALQAVFASGQTGGQPA